MRGYIGSSNTFQIRDDWEVSETINTIALFADGTIPLGVKFVGAWGKVSVLSRQYVFCSIAWCVITNRT